MLKSLYIMLKLGAADVCVCEVLFEGSWLLCYFCTSVLEQLLLLTLYDFLGFPLFIIHT